MSNYVLSNAAKQDLINIAKYGDIQFGIVQSNHYRDRLKQRFIINSNQPKLYPCVDHIRKGYRCSVCGVHSIYYRINDQSIIIERVLGSCPRTENLLRKTWVWSYFPLIFVKYTYILLKFVKNLPQTRFLSLRFQFSDKLLGRQDINKKSQEM